MSQDIIEMEAGQVEIGTLFGVSSGKTGTLGGLFILVSQNPILALDVHNPDDSGNIPEVTLKPNAVAFCYTGRHRSRHQELFSDAWVRARNQRPDLADKLL